MIDGRTIHFFFQFIEPILQSLYPDACLTVLSELSGQSVGGAVSPLKLVFAESERQGLDDLAFDGVTMLRRNHPIEIGMQGPSRSLSRLQQAVDAIDQVGLGFFLDLAVGWIAIGGKPLRRRCCVFLPNSSSATAGALMTASARCFFQLWLEAELAAQDNSVKSSEAAEIAADLFGLCVSSELVRRNPSLVGEDAGGERFDLLQHPRGMLRWLDRLAKVPLSRELFACWYPGWRRSAMIFGSPFNTMRDLRVATER